MSNSNTQDMIKIELAADKILCTEGESSSDLFFIESGEVLVFLTQKRKIVPLAILKQGEFIGEMSFFDNKPRSASVISLAPSVIHKISPDEIKKQFPSWLTTVAQKTIEKIRKLDHVIQDVGRKKQKNSSAITLDIKKEKIIYDSLMEHLSDNPTLL